MVEERLPDWEQSLIDEAIASAEARLEAERMRATKRAVQLAREQAYHRLAVEIDRPQRSKISPNQLSFWPDLTLFDPDA
jgi:ATP-dependent Clp protease ATP-binding subunit ClpA